MAKRSDDCEAPRAPGFLLQRGARLFARRVDHAMAALGIQTTHLHVLFRLRRDGALLQRDLLQGAPVGQPAMVGVVARLERLGYVTRQPCEGDGRAALIALTPGGEAAVEHGAAALEAANEQLLRGLDAEQRAALLDLLNHTSANLAEPAEDIYRP